jgi:hypothetical protein
MATNDYRQPTPVEKAKLDKSRAMMVEGINEEKSPITRLMPTMTKAARDQQKSATMLRNSVSDKAREGEAYNDAGYKHGGKVKKMAKGGSASSRADGCATKGKTKGTMVAMSRGGKAC